MAIDLSWLDQARATINARRAQLDEVEASLETAVRILGVPVFSPAPKSAPAPAKPAVESAPAPAIRVSGDVAEKVLAFFRKQTAPIRPSFAQDKLGFRNVREFRQIIEQLVTSKQLVRRGATISMRIGTPDVMASADQEGD